ncbi:1668_t:CDS:2 [Gigaspora margarita]|uniref:1668_t:CDS:1 n=1 Tax=Gigaspora margarita TaxID=4874 RepID=A0ABN7UXT5_GIGMA|nr:1668_t:CDS:2 [Gigaspora margarita]
MLSGGDNIVGDARLCSVGFLARKHCGPPYLRSVSLVGINTAAFVTNNTAFAIDAVLPLEIILAETKLKLVTIN